MGFSVVTRWGGWLRRVAGTRPGQFALLAGCLFGLGHHGVRLGAHGDDGAESVRTRRASGARPSSPLTPEEALETSIASAVNEALDQKRLPGCVVVLGRHDRVLFQKAFGLRQIEPQPEPMTLDTVFDLASLTKPIATATSIMILAERRAIDIDAPVTRYLPEFGARGKGAVTLRHLLVHVSGLPADTALGDYEHGRAEAIRRIAALPLRAAPGARFLYSDLGYLVLEEIVQRVTGTELATFVHDSITGPLGMTETVFRPAPVLHARTAPTEQRDGGWIRGEVHDPRAFRLGGIAGHAGLFSTASDLTLYAQALLRGGALGEHRILSARGVREMMAPNDVPGGLRALGWDIATSYSANRGMSLSRHAVGHGGYTGTSLWIDPDQDLFVLFLSNRVHPDGKGAINALAGRIATIAGELTSQTPTSPLAAVTFGIDELEAEGFRRLRGARVGLITNDSARDRNGERTVDVLRRAPGVQLAALFAPEHGLGADRDERVGDALDPSTGLPVHSLYGKVLRPTADMLAGIDTLVVDLQDAGVRFYTYASTLHRTMKVAAELDLKLLVLDRPNPINGVDVAGPLLKGAASTFVNHYPLPIRHGLTLGELAEMMNADEHLATALQVVPMRGWARSAYFDETGREWLAPSPNLRSLRSAVLYPGVAILEGTNIAVGRGTDRPFEVVGAPWIDGTKLAKAVAMQELEGIAVSPVSFRPQSSTYAHTLCHGVALEVRDRSRFEPVRTGLALAIALAKLYPRQWNTKRLDDILGDKDVTAAVTQGRSLADIEALWKDGLEAYRKKREKYLLYPAAGNPTATGNPAASGTQTATGNPAASGTQTATGNPVAVGNAATPGRNDPH